jgi:gluconokinase
VKDRLLILDLGSSSARAFLYDARGVRVAGGARRPQPWYQDEEGQAVLDAARLLDNVAEVIDEALDGLRGERVVAAGMTTLVGNLVGLTKAGEAVTPVYSYADTRSHAEAAELGAGLGGAAAGLTARTGCPFHPAYWPAQLLHLARKQPERFERAEVWTDLSSFLYWQWFGRPPKMSLSVASWAGMLDRGALDWSDELLAHLPVGRDRLLELADVSETITGLARPWAERWPALAEADFYLALGDGAAANLGSAALDEGALVVTIGSTSAARVVESGCPPKPRGLWAYRVDKSYSLLGGALSEGGASYAWLRERFKLPPPDALEELLSSQAPAAHGLTVLPFLKGERAPGWRAQASGVMLGLRSATSNEDIVRAWLEAVVYRLALVIERLPDKSRIVASGGALLASPVWQQILADVTQKPVYPVDERETSSRGLAYLLARYRGLEPPCSELLAPVMPSEAHREAHARAKRRQEALYDALTAEDELFF